MPEQFRVFPRQLFLRYILFQFAFYGLALGLFLFWLKVRGHMDGEEFQSLLPLVLFFILMLSVISSYFFVRPIWVLLTKIGASSASKRSLFETEFKGFSDFEYVLDRVSAELNRKRDQLRREREENQVFMNSVQEALVSMNRQERILYMNSQFVSLFLELGSADRKDLTLKEVFRDPDVFQLFHEALAEGESRRRNFQKVQKKSGEIRYFSISVTPLKQEGSTEVAGAVGIFYDVTEIKKSEEIRHEFVGNASHELRTPLTSIKGYMEMLREDLRAGRLEQIQGFLDIISNNVNRLIDLVNDLLSINALESTSSLRIEEFSPLVLSEQVINELLPLATESNQSVHVKSRLDVVRGDPRKLEQVVRNLVSNAIKYIGKNKEIQVVWEPCERAGWVRLQVIDNGPGIPPEHHERLFDRFYRVDKGRSRGAGGTGLGLAIVKHIIQSHGGSVHIHSKMDQGAEFICEIPQ